MIYDIRIDDTSIYDNSPGMVIMNPSLEMAVNEAGSLSFKMESNHSWYTLPKPLVSNVEVYEKGQLIWFGRVLDIDRDFFNNKVVYCEGAYAYFNDSIQRPKIFDSTTTHEFFRYLISEHNRYVPYDRQFRVGSVTVDNNTIYRELKYDKTIDALNHMCLEAEGGFIFLRRENKVNYIDWLSDMPHTGVQPVQFALNLLDINQHIDGSSIKTVILPLGAEVDGERITITDVNGGLDYIESRYVSQYGHIPEVVEFDDIFTPDELKAAAIKKLNSYDMDPLTITCDAAELSYIDISYPPFRIGQNVQVKSLPNGVDKVFPLTSINISLDSATKQVTLGTPEKRELTKIYKPNT